MPMVPITLPPGVVRPSTDGMARGRWWDTNLVRWRPGQTAPHLLPVGGWTRISPSPEDLKVRLIRSWRDLKDIRRTLYLSDKRVVTQEGSTFTDRTPADFVPDAPVTGTAGFGIGPYSAGTFGSPRELGDPRLYFRAPTWSADTFGEDMLFVSSSDGRLWLLSPSAVAGDPTQYDLPDEAEQVENAPISNRCMLVTDERHVMLFGAGGEPRRVAWSSREDYNDWDFSSTTNTAGFFDLDTAGFIVGACKIRGGILIFTDDEVWLCRYRGVPFVYGFERIGRACGIIAPLAYAVAAGTCFWMGRSGFWMFDGGTVRQVPCDVSDYVFDALDPITAPARVHASPNGTFPEAWFFYPEKGEAECNRLLIFSVDTGAYWWSVSRLKRTAMDAAGVYPYPLAADPDGLIYQHEDGWMDAGRSRVGTVYAETAAISLPVTGERRVHVLQAQMDSHYEAARVDVTAFTRETRNGDEVLHGPYTPREDGWTDLRFSGRDVRLRFVQGSDGDWTLGEMRFDVRQGGRR